MFTKEDLIHYKGLKKLVDEGTFDLKGGSIVTAALLKQWFEKLGKIIEEDIARNQAPAQITPKITPLKEKPAIKKKTQRSPK